MLEVVLINILSQLSYKRKATDLLKVSLFQFFGHTFSLQYITDAKVTGNRAIHYIQVL